MSFSGIRRAKLDVLHTTGHQSQQSRRYGVLLGHSASQARRAPHHRPPITAVPALRCPSRAFGEPSRTSLHELHDTTVPVVNWRGQDKMSSQLFTALLSVLISGYCVWCLVPRYPGSWICPCACRLGRWGRVARTHCKCCTVMSCGARRLRQDRGTRTPVSCARVSEGTLRTGTSMHCTIHTGGAPGQDPTPKGGGGTPPPLRTPKLSHGTRCFVGAGGAGDFVLGIRQGEFFLFHPMCLSSKYSEFCGEFKNG